VDSTHTPSGPVWRFDTFRVDLAARKLWNGDRPVPLTPKVFHIFQYLFEHRDRIVSKKELFEAVWPDRVVEEANLTQSISVLRKALGETNTATKYVATFPGVGYRFIAEAVEEHEAPAAEPSPGVERERKWRRLAAAVTIVAGAAAAGVWYLRSRPVPLTLGRARAVTHLRGREFQPALSPDGSRVAFTYHGELNAPLRIGVVEIQGGGAVRTLPGEAVDMFSPAWAPDGRRLAYLGQRGDKLRVYIREENGEEREIADLFPRTGLFERQLDWSPDGRMLAVTNKPAADDAFRIELIHIQERRRTTLTVPPALSDGDFEPRFSPDGAKLAFIRQNARANSEVLVVTLPSSEPVVLTPRIPLGSVDWTPDSASLVVSATREGTRGLWLLQPVTREARWRLIARTSPEWWQFSISRKTGRLATAAAEPDQNIWRARLSGAGIEGWERLVESTAHDYFPVLAPDGKRFTFISERSGDRQLWLREEGREERQLTFGPVRPSYNSWTGDGEEIVYSSLNERTLYRLKLKEGRPVRIPVAQGPVGSHTAVSPDGAWVFTVRRFYIYQTPVAGGAPRLLTDDGGYPLRLSSDGDWIFYTLHRFSQQIWRLRRSTGRAERLTDRLQAGCWACWAVNEQGLVYIASDPAMPTTLERLDLATRQVRVLGTLTGRLPPLGLGMLALTPDDRALLAVVAEPGVGDVELVEDTPWGAAAGVSNKVKGRK